MLSINLSTSSSIWYLPLCILLGAGYAWLLYRKNKVLEKRWAVILAIIRGSLISVLAILLLNPLLKLIGKTTEKPIIIFLQDNSSSIIHSKFKSNYEKEYKENLKNTLDELSSEFTLRYFLFDEKLRENKELDFSGKRTNISKVLDEIQDGYANQNVGAVILATDGIYNSGENPIYSAEKINAPFYTVAMGDTTPRKDLVLKNVEHNRIVYKGNNFMLNVQVSSYGLKNEKSQLKISDGEKTVFSSTTQIDKENYFVSIPVTISADEIGIKKYVISVNPIKGELTLLNNSKTIYIEVLEGKQKVLMIAAAPHPDLTAIKQSIESNRNYQVDIRLINQVDNAQLKNYSLLIIHQLPSSENPANTLLGQISAMDIPIWHILGNTTYTDLFNNWNSGLKIINSRNKSNEALAELNNEFYLFTLTEETKKEIRNFPPLSVPFGTYKLTGDFSNLFNQKIGIVQTDQPLWTFTNTGNKKISILVGEGIWKWRLQNYQNKENQDAVNELMSKTVQYLSSKDDKRRFRVHQPQNYFEESQDILFNGELYNDSYELVNEPEVSIEINSGKNRYNYVFSKSSNAYTLNAGSLAPGDYSWIAKTKLGKEEFEMKGRFLISSVQAELLDTRADHQLLYNLSERTGAKMIYPNQLEQLESLLKAREDIRTISYEQKKTEELINLKWLFFVLLSLVSVEWFVRKREGGY